MALYSYSFNNQLKKKQMENLLTFTGKQKLAFLLNVAFLLFI